jgi:hypothetical protein
MYLLLCRCSHCPKLRTSVPQQQARLASHLAEIQKAHSRWTERDTETKCRGSTALGTRPFYFLNLNLTYCMLGIFRTGFRTSIIRPKLPLIQPRTPQLPWCRTYALSRFTERATGTGRNTRRNIGPTRRPAIKESPQVSHEESPSIHESELWNVSSRRPSNNPEEGLRLLLQNEVLVITRLLLVLRSACRN